MLTADGILRTFGVGFSTHASVADRIAGGFAQLARTLDAAQPRSAAAIAPALNQVGPARDALAAAFHGSAGKLGHQARFALTRGAAAGLDIAFRSFALVQRSLQALAIASFPLNFVPGGVVARAARRQVFAHVARKVVTKLGEFLRSIIDMLKRFPARANFRPQVATASNAKNPGTAVRMDRSNDWDDDELPEDGPGITYNDLTDAQKQAARDKGYRPDPDPDAKDNRKPPRGR